MDRKDIAAIVLEILEGTNEKAIRAFATAKEGKISLYCQMGREIDDYLSYPSPFLDLYINSKEVYFYISPKSYLSEKACIKAVEELRREGFHVRGAISFVEHPECTI